MELAKLSSKCQITIPVEIREKLNIKAGDKIIFLEENGRIYLDNPADLAFTRVAQACEGAAAEAGFQSEEDMQNYLTEVRKEVRGY